MLNSKITRFGKKKGVFGLKKVVKEEMGGGEVVCQHRGGGEGGQGVLTNKRAQHRKGKG